MRSVKVFCNGVFAGMLSESDDRRYTFQYDGQYLLLPTPPVSLTLAKQPEPFTSSHLFPFFANLLPEGANKRTLCRRHHIDERDAFGLLLAFSGKEVIGNISFKDNHENNQL